MRLKINKFNIEIPVLDYSINLRLNEIGSANVVILEDDLELVEKATDSIVELYDDGNLIFKGIICKIKTTKEGEALIYLQHFSKLLDYKLFEKNGSYRVDYADVFSSDIFRDILTNETYFTPGVCLSNYVSQKYNFETKYQALKRLAENIIWGYNDIGDIRYIGYTVPIDHANLFVEDDGTVHICVQGAYNEMRLIVIDPQELVLDTSYASLNALKINVEIQVLSDVITTFASKSYDPYTGSSTTPELYIEDMFWVTFDVPQKTIMVFADFKQSDGSWVGSGQYYTFGEEAVAVFAKVEIYGWDDGTGNKYHEVKVYFYNYIVGKIEFIEEDITDRILEITDFSVDYSRIVNKVHVLGYGDEASQIYSVKEDTESQNKYGLREAVYTDRKLKYQQQAETVAENILALCKEPVRRLTVRVDSTVLKEKLVRLGQIVSIDGIDERLDGKYRVVEIQNWGPTDCELVLATTHTMLTDVISNLKMKSEDIIKYP